MVPSWRRSLSRLVHRPCRALVRADLRWLRYRTVRRVLLALERWANGPDCRVSAGADQLALLESAYCLRAVLQRYAGLEGVSVGLEADRVVLLLHQPLAPELQAQVQTLVEGSVEIRAAAEELFCCSLDGDHCNSDYDRS